MSETNIPFGPNFELTQPKGQARGRPYSHNPVKQYVSEQMRQVLGRHGTSEEVDKVIATGVKLPSKDYATQWIQHPTHVAHRKLPESVNQAIQNVTKEQHPEESTNYQQQQQAFATARQTGTPGVTRGRISLSADGGPVTTTTPPGPVGAIGTIGQPAGFAPTQFGPTPPPIGLQQSTAAQTYFGATPYLPDYGVPGATMGAPVGAVPFGMPQVGYQPTVSATGEVTPFTVPGTYVSPTPMSFEQLPMPPKTFEPMKMEAGIPGVGAFQFDIEGERQRAFEALKPFYDKLLSFSGGRVDLAKRILEYTYQQGIRESRQEYQQAATELAITVPEEREQMLTGQHRRGILESGFGKTGRERLVGTQDLRGEAIKRALENRESRLGAQRGFGLEEKQRGFEEERFGLHRERTREAKDVAMEKFGIKKGVWESEVAAAERKEAQRINKLQTELLQKQLGSFA